MTSMSDGEFDLALLRDLANDVPFRDDAAYERALTRLEEVMEKERELAIDARTRIPRTRILALVAAVVVLLTFSVQLLLPAGRGGPSIAAAALLSLGDTAGGMATTRFPAGAYAYEQLIGTAKVTGQSLVDGSRWTADVSFARERWVARDGSGRELSRGTGYTWPSPEDSRTWREAGSPEIPGALVVDDTTYRAGDLPFISPETLPSDPAELGTLIEQREILGSPPGPAGSFDIIGDLLRPRYLAPEQRAALFQVAAEIPGIVHDGTVTDAAGREGIGISITEGSTRLQLIFDPASSEVLGERRFETRSDGEEILMQEYTYLEAGIVASIDDRP